MIRVCGAAFVAAAVWLVGWQKASSLRRRAKALRYLCEWIRFAVWQLQYTAMPLFELAIQMEKRREYALLNIGGNFSENAKTTSFPKAWDDVVCSCVKRNALTKDDEEILRKFGAGLGKTDMAGQSAHGEFCVALLERQQKSAAAVADEKGHVTLTLWGAASIVSALLLI